MGQVGQSGTRIGVLAPCGYNFCHFCQRSGVKRLFTPSLRVYHTCQALFLRASSNCPAGGLPHCSAVGVRGSEIPTCCKKRNRARPSLANSDSRRRLAADKRLLSHAPHAPEDEFSRRDAGTPRRKLSWVSVRHVSSPRTAFFVAEYTYIFQICRIFKTRPTGSRRKKLEIPANDSNAILRALVRTSLARDAVRITF